MVGASVAPGAGGCVVDVVGLVGAGVGVLGPKPTAAERVDVILAKLFAPLLPASSFRCRCRCSSSCGLSMAAAAADTLFDACAAWSVSTGVGAGGAVRAARSPGMSLDRRRAYSWMREQTKHTWKRR
jgi:hypothetical protein